MSCILIITFFANAEPVKIEQHSCYPTFELCTSAIPVVAHGIKPVVNTGMAFRCVREERAI